MPVEQLPPAKLRHESGVLRPVENALDVIRSFERASPMDTRQHPHLMSAAAQPFGDRFARHLVAARAVRGIVVGDDEDFHPATCAEASAGTAGTPIHSETMASSGCSTRSQVSACAVSLAASLKACQARASPHTRRAWLTNVVSVYGTAAGYECPSSIQSGKSTGKPCAK